MVAPAPPEIPATLPHLLPQGLARSLAFATVPLASATPLLLITCLQVQWIQRVAPLFWRNGAAVYPALSVSFGTLSIVTGVVPSAGAGC